jgi:uncharacterized protein DUF1918
METMRPQTMTARAGDSLLVRAFPGRPAREGEILDVLGEPGHEYYRVRWDEDQESTHFPLEGVTFVRRRITGSMRRR